MSDSKPPGRSRNDATETLAVHDRTAADAGLLDIRWLHAGQEHTAIFTEPLLIGRDADCDIRIEDAAVSRVHARLWPEGGQWHVEDQGSSNGSFLDSVRIQHAVLPRSATLQLGTSARLQLTVPAAPQNFDPEEIAERYFGDGDAPDAGPRTVLVRDTYRKVARRQKRRYRGVIAAVGLALVAAIGVGVWQYRELQQMRALATELFYSMKTVEVELARIEDLVRESGDTELLSEAEERRDEIAELETRYDEFLEELDVLGPDLSAEDRIILKVARMFGECELTVPPGFVDEVKKYIAQWRVTSRLRNSIARMQEQDLAAIITQAMLDQSLPPQFLYVALQESGFRPRAVGPETRFGIAKGIWQFIPSTAQRYGLRTGPLVDVAVHDPMDDRFKPEEATLAAARYLRDIYSKDAQASGLLVMASYNWGPNNILRRIRSMPNNPRERNFWQLLQSHTIPSETYDYVFYIFSAIVIGEDPALFGFGFEPPLADLLGEDQSV
jgi:membrane-bound lytic murein transglycosylase D